MSYHLLAISDPGCAASQRYRLVQHQACLEALEIDVRMESWPRERSAQSELLHIAANSDAILFLRILPELRLIRRLRQAAKRLMYDFDDAIVYVESSHRSVRLRPVRWLRFRAMVRLSDLVTAGNSYLASLAGRCQSREVRVVPTTVHLERYIQDQGMRDAAPVIGWIGGRWTLPYLEQLREPLGRLSQEDGVTVRVIADLPGRLGAARSDWVNWEEGTEVRELKRLSVGLAPLPDDRWTRGKCGLRLLQYLAAGVPAVASPVGVQAELIDSGAALAARSPDEWVAAVRKLLTDTQTRDRVVQRGREVVRAGYDAAEWGPRLAALWRGSA